MRLVLSFAAVFFFVQTGLAAQSVGTSYGLQVASPSWSFSSTAATDHVSWKDDSGKSKVRIVASRLSKARAEATPLWREDYAGKRFIELYSESGAAAGWSGKIGIGQNDLQCSGNDHTIASGQKVQVCSYRHGAGARLGQPKEYVNEFAFFEFDDVATGTVYRYAVSVRLDPDARGRDDYRGMTHILASISITIPKPAG